jgi:hypothetical protein
MSMLLPLVIDIVDVVHAAQRRRRKVDTEAEAERLAQAHPEADKDKGEVAAILRQQQDLAELEAEAGTCC